MTDVDVLHPKFVTWAAGYVVLAAVIVLYGYGVVLVGVAESTPTWFDPGDHLTLLIVVAICIAAYPVGLALRKGIALSGVAGGDPDA